MLSNSYGQDLFKHSIAVGLLSKKIFEKYFPERIFENIFSIYNIEKDSRTFNYKFLGNILFNIGVYHDIGKLDPNFQSFLKETLREDLETFDVQIESTKEKKDFDINCYPLHHEISWSLISTSSMSNKQYKSYHQNLIEYVIYWHHAKVLRKDNPFENAKYILQCRNLNLESIIESLSIFTKKVEDYLDSNKMGLENLYSFDENNKPIDLIEACKKNAIPDFQSLDFLNTSNYQEEIEAFIKNSLGYLFRSIIVSADRIISELSSELLNEIFEEEDYDSLILGKMIKDDNLSIEHGINLMLDSFYNKYGNSPRNLKQRNVAEELSKINDISVLSGPAGVGKTKIMLDWVNKKNKKNKVFIITPKTSICYSLYKEMNSEYLSTNRVEIITGDIKERSINGIRQKLEDNDVFNSDFNITTIDQLLNLMMSHKKIDIFLEVLNSTIIFDEFHEFLDTPGIIMLFIQFIILKRMSINNDCLLVSATPNPYLLKKKLNISQKNIIKLESFNNTNYNIDIKKFEDKKYDTEVDNDMYHAKKIGQIILFNSATKAQISAIKSIKEQEKNTLVYHSKFFRNEKSEIFYHIIDEFGKKNRTKRNVLRTGPILQASVDISTHSMLTEISNIDNIFQRLGRVVRWGENDKGEYYIYIPTNLDEKNTLIRKGLENTGSFNSAKAFADFISKKLTDKKLWTLNELYPLYDEFFTSKEVLKAYDEDWENIKEKSKEVFSQKFEPIKIVNRRKQKKEKLKTLAKKSLRGKSIFALACTLEYQNNQEKIIEPEKDFSKYLFTVEKKFNGEENTNNILEDNRLQINENFNNSPYLYEIRMKLKEKNIIAKKSGIEKIPPWMFLDFARDEETPLILSFKQRCKQSKMNKEEERFNIKYETVNLGLMNYSLFKKIK